MMPLRANDDRELTKQHPWPRTSAAAHQLNIRLAVIWLASALAVTAVAGGAFLWWRFGDLVLLSVAAKFCL
jgi:hypothetical protein